MEKNKEQDIDRVEEIPIEEFENDNQDISEEFKKRFKDKKEPETIKKGHEQWL